MRNVVLPHTFKVAIFVAVSAGLTYLLNNVANLNLTEIQQAMIIVVINALLAGLKKYQDKK